MFEARSRARAIDGFKSVSRAIPCRAQSSGRRWPCGARAPVPGRRNRLEHAWKTTNATTSCVVKPKTSTRQPERRNDDDRDACDRHSCHLTIMVVRWSGCPERSPYFNKETRHSEIPMPRRRRAGQSSDEPLEGGRERCRFVSTRRRLRSPPRFDQMLPVALGDEPRTVRAHASARGEQLAAFEKLHITSGASPLVVAELAGQHTIVFAESPDFLAGLRLSQRCWRFVRRVEGQRLVVAHDRRPGGLLSDCQPRGVCGGSLLLHAGHGIPGPEQCSSCPDGWDGCFSQIHLSSMQRGHLDMRSS
jgi:hypothetical protein